MNIAELIDKYRNPFKAKYKHRIFPRHLKALDSIARCRTSACGEIIVRCPQCGKVEFKSHSCGHRNCPRCQNHECTEWLERQRDKLLPVPYFLVTFTIPAQLRFIAWKFQRVFFESMFKSAAESLKDLAAKERFLGGDIGMTGVLHTNNRRLDFHPHIHFMIPAGALDRKLNHWKRKHWKFLFPVKALGKLFRGKMFNLLKNSFHFPACIWDLDWVVHSEETGSGDSTLKYLAKYLYRGVIGEKAIISDSESKVTFTYREGKSGKHLLRTLPGEDFLWLIVSHVLPKGFRRVRDYGFLHGNAKETLTRLQLFLNVKLGIRIVQMRPQFKCPDCGTKMNVVACRIVRFNTLATGPPILKLA